MCNDYSRQCIKQTETKMRVCVSVTMSMRRKKTQWNKQETAANGAGITWIINCVAVWFFFFFLHLNVGNIYIKNI